MKLKKKIIQILEWFIKQCIRLDEKLFGHDWFLGSLQGTKKGVKKFFSCDKCGKRIEEFIPKAHWRAEMNIMKPRKETLENEANR